MPLRVMITGSNGFIGTRVVYSLFEKTDVLIRSAPGRTGWGNFEDERIEHISFRNLDGNASWKNVLADVDVVLHLAARVHLLNEFTADPLSEYRKINVEGTLNLATQAAQAGVKRFIYISSIGVNGNKSSHPFTIQDSPNPVEPYAISKHEAEQGLYRISEESGMEFVTIRPALVYGPGAPGNFGRLIRLVQKGLPLPLGLVRNKRSFVALENLVDLIVLCIYHPSAAGQTFLVSDGEDLSTPDLIRKMARTMGRSARLLPVPMAMLRLGGRMLGKESEVERLIGSLQVDISHTCDTLGWRPPVSLDEAILSACR